MKTSGELTFHYRCIYAVEGIIDPDPELDHKLLQEENVEVRILGINAYERLVGMIVCPGGQKGTDDSDDRARQKLDFRRNTLIHQAGRHAVVCVESSLSSDVVSTFKEGNSECPAYTKAPLKKNAERAFKAISAAMTLARDGRVSKNYDFIHDHYYATESPSGATRMLNPASVSEGGSMSKLNADEIRVAEKLAFTLFRDPEINRIIDTYSASLTPYKSGHLHAFIGAWTALEMFIDKQFKEIQSRLTININGAEAHKDFSKRMTSVMEGKYRLVDKFAALSSYYGDVDSDKEVEELKSIKKVRDEFFHSMKGEVADLPLDRTRLLVSKYLQVYLERKKSGFTIQRNSEA